MLGHAEEFSLLVHGTNAELTTAKAALLSDGFTDLGGPGGCTLQFAGGQKEEKKKQGAKEVSSMHSEPPSMRRCGFR